MSRVCTACGKEFPETIKYFNWHNKAKGTFRSKCRGCIRLYQKQYYTDNSVLCNARTKRWSINNSEKHNATRKLWAEIHKEQIAATARRWSEKNKDKRAAIRRRAMAKYRSTAKGTINNRMATAINRALRGSKNGRAWEVLVGYTLRDLKKHLEKQFADGMTWDKFLKGEIHIDHKTPKSVFNYVNPEDDDFKKCWALSNLQPLWAADNMVKKNILDKHFQPSLVF